MCSFGGHQVMCSSGNHQIFQYVLGETLPHWMDYGQSYSVTNLKFILHMQTLSGLTWSSYTSIFALFSPLLNYSS